MPNGSDTNVATSAMRSESWIATQSDGERSSNGRLRPYDTGLIKKLKPYFSKIVLAAGPRRKLI